MAPGTHLLDSESYPDSLGQEWRDIVFSIGDIEILRGVSGMTAPGKLTAILGPSGSGKTTLLNVLSGRQRLSGYSKTGSGKQRVTFAGEVTCRGTPVSTAYFRGKTAYVFQQNALLDSDTPRESLEFSAFLRLPRSVSREDREALVDKIIHDLHLDACKDIAVGGPMRKGLSGGEQKRTAVGVELIASPKLLFLDEPISGLDSFSAFSLTQTLQRLARTGVPVVMTVHQPSSEIYDMFDDVLFLHRGEVVYQGPRDDVGRHFEQLGFKCPPSHNPADFVMFVITSEEADVVTRMKDMWRQSEAFKNMSFRIDRAGSGFKARSAHAADSSAGSSGDDDSGSCTDEGSEGKGENNVFGVPTRGRNCLERQVALFKRDIRIVYRDMNLLLSMYVQALVVSLIYGWLFLGAGNEEGKSIGMLVVKVADDPCSDDKKSFVADQCVRAFQVHWGALSILAINAMMVSIGWAVTVFQRERPVFLREASGGYYNSFTYFISKTIFELPLLGMVYIVSIAAVYFLMGLQANPASLVLEVLLLSTASSSMVFCISALASNAEQAFALAPIVQIPQFAFAGILLPNEMVPISLRWIKWICPLFYGMNTMANSEWRDTFDAYGECFSKTDGNLIAMLDRCPGTVVKVKALESQGVSEDSFWWPAVSMSLIIILGFRLLGALILWHKSRFVL